MIINDYDTHFHDNGCYLHLHEMHHDKFQIQ